MSDMSEEAFPLLQMKVKTAFEHQICRFIILHSEAQTPVNKMKNTFFTGGGGLIICCFKFLTSMSFRSAGVGV